MAQILAAAVFGFFIGMPLTLFIAATSRDSFGRPTAPWSVWTVRLALLSSVLLPAVLAIASGASAPAIAFWVSASISPWVCWQIATKHDAARPPTDVSSQQSSQPPP